MNPFDELNARFDQNRLNQFMQQGQQMLQPQQQQVQKPKKNFLVDQISTVGGIAGGIAGLPLGLLGAGGGAAIGSGLGETLENVLTGDDWNKNVVKEVALGGVFGAGPIRLAKAGIGAVKGGLGATTGATSSVAGDAGQQVLKTSMRGKIGAQGDKLLASQYGTIGRPTIKSSNPAQTISDLANYGITKPQDAERIAGAITGSNGLLNKQVVAAVGKAGVVPTNNIPTVLSGAIDDFGIRGMPYEKSITNTVKAQMEILQKNGSKPETVLQVMKNLEKRAANLQGKGGNYGMPTPERVDQANALLKVRDELQDQLYNAAGANKNLAGVLTPQLRQQLVDLQPNNPQWQNFVDSKVMSATDISQLRNAQSPFVNIKNIIDDSADNAFSASSQVANSLSNVTIPGMAATAAQKMGTRPVGQMLRKIGGNAQSGATGAIAPNTRRGIIGKVGIGAPIAGSMINAPQAEAMGLEDAILGGQSVDPNMPYQQDSMSAPTPSQMNNSNMSQPYQQNTPPSNPFGLDRDQVAMAMTRALQAGDTQAFEELNTMYTLIGDYESTQGNGQPDYNSTTASSLAMSANGVSTLDQLEQLYSGTGGGSGKLMGAVQNVLGNAGFNDNTASYNALANSSVSQLAKAINGGGQVSDADAAVIISALPKVTDSPEVARTKFAALKQRLENARQNTMMYNGGGSQQPATLEDIYATQGGIY